MLRVAILSPHTSIADQLESRLESLNSGPDTQTILLRSFHRDLSTEELSDFSRARSPQVLFVDVSRGPAALLQTLALAQESPGLFPVAISEALDPVVMLEAMNRGVREFLVAPFDLPLLAASLRRLQESAREAPRGGTATDQLYSFLPAKPGAGASTLAVHTARALATLPHASTLLADFDLSCGTTGFLLKAQATHGMRDALARGQEIDDALWQELSSSVHGLSLLPQSVRGSNEAVDPGTSRPLLEFARRRYRIILTDHSGMLESHSMEVLQQSRRIMLVVTPDLATVSLARDKVRYLEAADLRDRICLLLNQWRKDAPLTVADLEQVLGLPVDHTFSHAPDQIYKAILRGGEPEPNSTHAKEIQTFARAMASEKLTEKRPPAKRGVESFSIIPSRYSIHPNG
jgi:pilus assembly protein CpaE